MSRLWKLPMIACSSWVVAYAKCEDAKIDKEDPIAFIEPYTLTKFYPELSIQKNRRKEQLPPPSQVLNFVGAGLRCMLGESALCHIPATRVYTFGLYVDKSFPFGNEMAPDYDDYVLKNRPERTKTIRLFVNVTKTGRHWATGYRQTLSKRIRRNALHWSREKRDRLYEDCNTFSKVFQREGTIVAGTEICYTWCDNKVVIEIDNVVKKVIKSNEFAELLFQTYLANDSVNPAVSKTIRANWYQMLDLEGCPQQKALRSSTKETQIEHEVKCVMKGNNRDLYMSSNIQHQNRAHLVNHVPYFKDDWDGEDDEEDEGTYYRPSSRRW